MSAGSSCLQDHLSSGPVIAVWTRVPGNLLNPRRGSLRAPLLFP